MQVTERELIYEGYRCLVVHHVPGKGYPSWYSAYVRVPFSMVRKVTLMDVHRGFSYGTWLTNDAHPWMMKWPSGKTVEEGYAIVGWDYNYPDEVSMITDAHVEGDIKDLIDRIQAAMPVS